MTIDASRSSSSKTKGQALEGLSSSYSNGFYLKCNGHGRTMSNLDWSRIFVSAQDLRHGLPNPYIVSTIGAMPERAAEMGAQVKIRVSWEEIEAGHGLHPHGELWIRVLSEKPMSPSASLPDEVRVHVETETLGRYYATVCDWQPDLREDDDETIPEWPYEQWWALPKMRTSA